MKRFLFVLLFLPLVSLKVQENDVVDVRPVIEFGSFTFEELKTEPIVGVMHDAVSLELLDATKFDITVEVENDFLYEKPRLTVVAEKIILDVHPKGDWCECLFPTNLNINIVSAQKAGAFDNEGKNYVTTKHPIHITVEKNRAWLPRCFWVILSIIGMILLFVYLWSIQHKCRFKKGAMMNCIYYDRYGSEVDDQGGKPLRKPGFGAWVARWFWPKDEHNTLSFDTPYVSSLPVTASSSQEVVLIPKSGIDTETMEIDGYEPDNDKKPNEPVKLGNNGTIIITKSDGSKDGFLRFVAGEEREGPGYRILLTVLMGCCIIGVAGFIFLMIKSFM